MSKEVQLLGFNLTKILVEKNPEHKGKVEIKSDIKIQGLEKQNLELIKEDALKIKFFFNLDYGGLGKIDMHGEFSLLLAQDDLKEVLQNWQKTEIEKDFRTLLLNIIMQKCSVKAIQIQDDFQLPIHINIPVLQIKSADQSDSTASSKK